MNFSKVCRSIGWNKLKMDTTKAISENTEETQSSLTDDAIQAYADAVVDNWKSTGLDKLLAAMEGDKSATTSQKNSFAFIWDSDITVPPKNGNPGISGRLRTCSTSSPTPEVSAAKSWHDSYANDMKMLPHEPWRKNHLWMGITVEIPKRYTYNMMKKYVEQQLSKDVRELLQKYRKGTVVGMNSATHRPYQVSSRFDDPGNEGTFATDDFLRFVRKITHGMDAEKNKQRADKVWKSLSAKERRHVLAAIKREYLKPYEPPEELETGSVKAMSETTENNTGFELLVPDGPFKIDRKNLKMVGPSKKNTYSWLAFLGGDWQWSRDDENWTAKDQSTFDKKIEWIVKKWKELERAGVPIEDRICSNCGYLGIEPWQRSWACSQHAKLIGKHMKANNPNWKPPFHFD